MVTFQYFFNLFAEGGSQKMCPSLSALSLAKESKTAVMFLFPKSCIYLSYRTGLHKWETKIFHTPGKVSKGWLLCLPLHAHQMLQTNTHVCSRPFVGVRNCGSQVIQSLAFSRYKWETLRKWVLPLHFWSEFSFQGLWACFLHRSSYIRVSLVPGGDSSTSGRKWHWYNLYHM